MLEARAISKRYPGVTALDGVDLSVNAGEVVGLIGENGAGKSTLIKVLAGLTEPDAGTIFVDGKEVSIDDAATATRLGIGVIHQELNNLNNLDIAGNVVFGREPRKFGFLIDRQEAERRASVFLKRVGLDLPPNTPLQSLSIAEQQLVEIAKALSLEARLLIMDEPTSSLTAYETETLMKIVQDLRAQGVGIVYVSHRLGEVKLLADRVVGLRDGKNAGELPKGSIEEEGMVRLMVGRDLDRTASRNYVRGPERLVVDKLRTQRFPQHEVSFEVREGEIVGMAGLVGAGRSEVARAIFGVDDRESGKVTLEGKSIESGSPSSAIEQGLYLAPEDRRREGVLTTMCVRENVTMASVPEYARAGIIDRSREAQVATEMREQLRIKAPSIEGMVRDLSGGNQQKVVLGKWLSMKPRCLIVDEPTRGIDIGARGEIYGIMRALAAEGVAILMISSDMEEVLNVSDRVLVMQQGQLMGSLTRDEATQEAVMRLAVGSA